MMDGAPAAAAACSACHRAAAAHSGYPPAAVRGQPSQAAWVAARLIIIGVVLWALGLNPLALLGGLAGGGLGGGLGQSISPQQSPQVNRQTGTNGKQDEMREFMEVIMGSTEEVWTNIFKGYGKTYPLPKLNLFEGQVRSACGIADSAAGPFYCPGDSQVYIDLSFYNTLSRQFGAKGDFAQAYVLAHEVGHHVQNIIGVLPELTGCARTWGKSRSTRLR